MESIYRKQTPLWMSDEIKSYYFSELYTWTIYKTCAVDSHNPILNEWIESSILQQVSFHQDQEKYKEWLGKNNIYIKVCTKSFLDVCMCVCVLCPEHSPISSNNKQTNLTNKRLWVQIRHKPLPLKFCVFNLKSHSIRYHCSSNYIL